MFYIPHRLGAHPPPPHVRLVPILHLPINTKWYNFVPYNSILRWSYTSCLGVRHTDHHSDTVGHFDDDGLVHYVWRWMLLYLTTWRIRWDGDDGNCLEHQVHYTIQWRVALPKMYFWRVGSSRNSWEGSKKEVNLWLQNQLKLC